MESLPPSQPVVRHPWWGEGPHQSKRRPLIRTSDHPCPSVARVSRPSRGPSECYATIRRRQCDARPAPLSYAGRRTSIDRAVLSGFRRRELQVAELRDRTRTLKIQGQGGSELAKKLRRALWRHLDRARRARTRPESSSTAMPPALEVEGDRRRWHVIVADFLLAKLSVPRGCRGRKRPCAQWESFARCEKIGGPCVRTSQTHLSGLRAGAAPDQREVPPALLQALGPVLRQYRCMSPCAAGWQAKRQGRFPFGIARGRSVYRSQ